MLSLIGNVALPEVLVIAAIAVIIFGRRLPEVAARAYGQFHKARESLNQMRRESGIDRELREIQRNVQDASRRASLPDSLEPPPGLTHARETSAQVLEQAPKDDAAPSSPPETEASPHATDAVREAGKHDADGDASGPVDRLEP